MSDPEDRPSIGDTFRGAVSAAAMIAMRSGPDALMPGRQPQALLRNLGVSNGLRDVVRDVPWAVVWITDFVVSGVSGNGNTADQGNSDGVQQGIENFWNEYVKGGSGIGNEDFRLAAGWRLPPDMPYDGQRNPTYVDGDSAGKEIEEIRDISAIFYRNPQGQVEVMTMRDPRWSTIVPTYMATQIATIAASMGAGTFQGAANAPRVLTFGAHAVGAMETAGSIGFLAETIAQPIYFRPAAMTDMARMFSNPAALNTDSARNAVNTLLGQYSHITGTSIEQIYFRSVHGNESPWERLDQISKARIEGVRRETPFEDIRGLPGVRTAEGISPNDQQHHYISKDTNIRDLLIADPSFNRSFYSLADRALRGGLEVHAPEGIRLSDQEAFALRFMLNVTQPIDSHLSLASGPVPADNHQRREQRWETADVLEATIASTISRQREGVSQQAEMAADITADSGITDLERSIAIERASYATSDVSPADIRAFASQGKAEWTAREQEETARNIAEAEQMGRVWSQTMVMMP